MIPDVVRGSTWCFDCDGTILDTSATFETAHAQAIVALGGTPVRDYWQRRCAGESEETLFAAAGLPASEYARYQTFKQQVFDTCTLTPPPLPGAAALIGRLWSSGAHVVVISHRPTVDSLVSDLASAGLLRFLSNVHATKAPLRGGDAPPNPRTAKADILKGFAVRGPIVMVGDSVSDIAAAEAVPIDSIGVASGCCSMSRLAAAGATWVMPSLRELYATLFRGETNVDVCLSPPPSVDRRSTTSASGLAPADGACWLHLASAETSRPFGFPVQASEIDQPLPGRRGF